MLEPRVVFRHHIKHMRASECELSLRGTTGITGPVALWARWAGGVKQGGATGGKQDLFDLTTQLAVSALLSSTLDGLLHGLLFACLACLQNYIPQARRTQQEHLNEWSVQPSSSIHSITLVSWMFLTIVPCHVDVWASQAQTCMHCCGMTSTTLFGYVQMLTLLEIVKPSAKCNAQIQFLHVCIACESTVVMALCMYWA